jgi:hypothetical protein
MVETRLPRVRAESHSDRCVSSPLTRNRQHAAMSCAAIGALDFRLVATSVAVVPDVSTGRSLRGGDLEFVAHREDGQEFLVIDYRADRGSSQPARVEVWKPASNPELDLSYLLVIADRRPQPIVSVVEPEVSLTGMVERMLGGCRAG